MTAPCSSCWQLVAANSLRPARCFQLLPAARRCHLAAARACGAQHRPGATFVQSCLRPQPFVAALCVPQNQPFTGSLGTPNPQQITVYHYCDCQLPGLVRRWRSKLWCPLSQFSASWDRAISAGHLRRIGAVEGRFRPANVSSLFCAAFRRQARCCQVADACSFYWPLPPVWRCRFELIPVRC